MIFIETPAFTRRVLELLDDDDYSQFQTLLRENPEAGDVIAGTGGLRKIRVAAKGTGNAAERASSTTASPPRPTSRCC